MDETEYEFRKIVIYDTFSEVDKLLVTAMVEHIENSRSHQAVILGVIINRVRDLKNYLAQSLENMSSEDMNELIKKYGGSI